MNDMPPSTPNTLPPLDTCPPHWQQWIMENLLEGVPSESILAVLEESLPLENLPASLGPPWLNAIQHHPLYLGTQPLQFQALKQKALLGILHDLDQENLTQPDNGIDRLANISAETFLSQYYSTNRPVILENALADWPLFHTWTLEAFKANYGDIPVSVQLNRNKHPQAYQRQFDNFCSTLALKDYIEKIEETPHSNDFYLAAKNQVFQTTALKEALKDVGTLPSFLDPSPHRLEAESYLWMGPGGTQTDLHHDWMNALIIQVMGRKHYKIVSSKQTPWVYNRESRFSDVVLTDPENPASNATVDLEKYPLFQNAQVIEFILEPGQCVFMPVGWWHEITALDVSISLTMTQFKYNNTYDWMVPTHQ